MECTVKDLGKRTGRHDKASKYKDRKDKDRKKTRTGKDKKDKYKDRTNKDRKKTKTWKDEDTVMTKNGG